MLKNSSFEWIDIKVSDNEYYHIEIKYLPYRYSYPFYMLAVPIATTVIAWVVYIAGVSRRQP